MTVAEVVEWIMVVGAVCASLLTFTALVGGVLHMGWRLYVRPHLDRIEAAASSGVADVKVALEEARAQAKADVAEVKRQVADVAHQVAPNGHENEGHPDDAGVPLRTLVLRQGREIRGHTQRLDEGGGWMREHNLEHVRQNPQWQQQHSA